MLTLTNATIQEVAPGQIVIFNLPVLHTGKWECYKEGSGSIELRAQNAIYEVHFSADICATAVGEAQLTIAVDCSPLNETTMTATTTTVGKLNNVAKTTAVKTSDSSEYICIVNTGTTPVTVANSLLFIKRTA